MIGLGRPKCVGPELPRKLMSGETDRVLMWEYRHMAPRTLDPATDRVLAKQIETSGKQAGSAFSLFDSESARSQIQT